MKNFGRMLISIGSCLILLPIFIVQISGIEIGSQRASTTIEEEVQKDIINEETLIGILAKEIPYTYEIEAIKAQAIVIRTYMARRILGIQTQGAIVGYTKEEMRQLWGDEHYSEIYNIYKEAVEATSKKIIIYDHKPIEALYHEASSGKTRSAENVYKEAVPYLRSVDSSVDQISRQVKYTKKEVVERIRAAYPSLVVDTSTLEEQLQIVKRDEADYVTALQIGNITLSGEQFKNLLELPSYAFKIHHSGEELIFDIRGIGDGIGMSLNGANEFAKQGMLCEDILRHYYTDISIEVYEVQ